MQGLVRSIWLCAALLSPASAHAEEFYRYVGRDGRVVYTNIAEQVPVAERERSRLDLSRISLNSELGAELDHRFAQQHAELGASTYCQTLRQAVDQGALRRAWDEFGPLIVCGGLLLAFLLYTPFAMRRFGAPAWAKTLMMAIPTLAIGGVVTFTMAQTNKAMGDLKRQLEPCASETYEKLADRPQALLERAQLVTRLQRAIERAQDGLPPAASVDRATSGLLDP